MEKQKVLDILDLGKNTFNFHYNSLRATKKSLKNYLTIIESFTKSINDHKKSIGKNSKEIKQFSESDIPFPIVKKFEIIINSYYNFTDSFSEIILNNFDNLKKTIFNSLTYVSNYLNFSQILAMNIKNTSQKYYKNYDKLMESLGETEMSIIEDYTKSKYKICLNKLKNKEKDKEKLVKESLFLEREFLNTDYEMKDKVFNYIDEYNSIMNKIKPKISKLNEDVKNDILNIIETMKNTYNNFITLLHNESEKINDIDNNENFKKETNEYLNYRIKKDKNCELVQAINLDKYNIKIIKEEEKIILENENYNSKLKNKKITKALFYSSQDIYNMVKIIYNYNFEMVNKDKFNLDNEEKKIKIIELMKKILNYNFDTHEFGKEKEITKEEKNYFLDLIFSKDEYFMQFLLCLNNYRTTGKYEMTQELFNTVKLIFDKKADYLFFENNKKISNSIIILSQTFYIMKDEKKYFLQKEIKKKELFKSPNFWIEHLNDNIQEELLKFQEESKRNGIIYSEEKKKKKYNDIIFTKMASLVTSLGWFELEKEKIDEILAKLFDKYNLSDEIKESILQIMQIN